MLPKSLRVDKTLFDEIRKNRPNTILKTSHITFKYYRYPSKHFAVVISKKVVSKANKRVKIKRVIKKCLQEKLDSLDSGVYLFIVTSPDFLKKTYEENCVEVNSALSKIP